MTDKIQPIKLPWGGAGIIPVVPNTGQSPPQSFHEVMSEDLAVSLQQSLDNESFPNEVDEASAVFQDLNFDDTTNDFMVAQLLQYEYDREYDKQIVREEKHINKNCKLGVSYNKFKMCPDWYGKEAEDELQDIDDKGRCIDTFEESEKTDPIFPAKGYVKTKDGIITKHDSVICWRKNAQRVMDFPPGINTGDGGGFDMKLTNRVYNNLHRQAVSETKRRKRRNDKFEKATSGMALDKLTKMRIFSLISDGTLQNLNGQISSGKESVVFHADAGTDEVKELPPYLAVKIFKTGLTDFKNREAYIKADYRFKDRMSKSNNDLNIKLWAEKEYHNLKRLNKAGVLSPEIVRLDNHILVMSFLGEDRMAAPKLKRVHLSKAKWASAYEQIVEGMIKMYHVCKLVHADLSEYNILWYKDQCWFIDLGQAVEPSHPKAFKFLLRDCTNIIIFFKSKGLTNLPSPVSLFEQVTQIPLPERTENGVRGLEAQRDTGDSTLNDEFFDYYWKMSQKQLETNSSSESIDI